MSGPGFGKRLEIADGEFELVSVENSATVSKGKPTIGMSPYTLTINCFTISREAFERIANSYREYLESNSKAGQSL